MGTSLDRSLDLLARTPAVLRALLEGLEEDWVLANEGPDTYSPYDIVGHLIHGEDTDWVPRAKHILAHGEETPFTPFDRDGMRARPPEVPLVELLDLFEKSRGESLASVRQLELGPADLERVGRHPEFGRVTLGQLISTWVVHDLAHLSQVTRVLAKARGGEVGPWKAYLRVLSDRVTG